jgi:hypothetical protein
MFAAHPRPLALCQDEETYYRGVVTGMWTRAPAPGREKCSELASQSERAKYEVLSRCLRAAISEAVERRHRNDQTVATKVVARPGIVAAAPAPRRPSLGGI